MPGQIVSVPFMSQIEDVDKYLTEYRTLKQTPQGTAVGLQQGPAQQGQFRHHGRSGSHGAVGVQRKRLSQLGGSGGLGQYGVMNIDATGGNAVGKRFHVNGLQMSYGGQQMLTPLQGSYQKAYNQMFYPGSGKIGSESSVSLPLMSAAQQGTGHQQNFMASSSSSGSTSPSRLQTSISGGSAVNSLGSEYGESIMTGDFHGQYDGVGFGHTSAPSPAINNFNMGSPFIQTSSPPTSTSSGANDFMQVLPSSLLNDGGVSNNMTTLTGSRSMVASMFSPNQFSSSSTQSSFATLHTAASTWGNPSTLSTAGSTSVDQPNATSTTSGSFGIWNNDMSVWG